MPAWPAPRPAATPSRSPRWPPEPPGRSAPWRCTARASRNPPPPAGRRPARPARTAPGTPLLPLASIGPVPGAPSLPPRRTRVPRTRPGTRVLCRGRAASGRTPRRLPRPQPGRSAYAWPRSGTTWAPFGNGRAPRGTTAPCSRRRRRGLARCSPLPAPAADGASVAVTYSKGADAAASIVKEIERGGGKAIATQADAADADAVRNAVEKAVTTLGRLDVLVNNAGTAIPMKVEETTLADFDRVFAVNVRGVFVATQAALKHLKTGGRTIMIASAPGQRVHV